MLSLILGSALAAASAAEPKRDPAQPSGSFQGLITPNDYPSDALDRSEEGSVMFRVKIDEKGAVKDCIIEESSGSAALDAQTCRLVWMRTKLTPGVDKQGHPVAGETTARIHWRIARMNYPNEDWATHAVITVPPGSPPSCRLEVEGALQSLDDPSSVCSRSGSVKLAMPSSAKRYEVLIDQQFKVGAEPPQIPHPGAELLSRQVAQLEIDANGDLTTCRLLEAMGPSVPGYSGVCSTVGKHFTPKNGPDGKPAPFRAYFVLAGYRH